MAPRITYNKPVSAESGAPLTKPAATLIPPALANFDSLPDSANVRVDVVRALFACSRMTVWRKSKPGGSIPQPRKLSENISAWNVGELRKALRGEAWK
jgi:predicted DNA-binding transcriptional regulator AlpA